MAPDLKYELEKTCPPLAELIVSADDFGQSPRANARILELLSLKKLQRVSVLVNGNFSAEEIHQLLTSPIKLDLHLDLAGLLENDQDGGKKTGTLRRLLVFFRNYLSGKISRSRVEKDWTEQLEKFRAIFGRYPDGLNSHEHIHFFPLYFKLILTLAKKSGTNYIRFGKKDFVKITRPVSLILSGLRKINRHYFQEANLISSDFLISLDWLKKYTSAELTRLPSGEIELIAHPERTAEWEYLKTHVLI